MLDTSFNKKSLHGAIRAKNSPFKIGLLGILVIFGFLYSNLSFASFNPAYYYFGFEESENYTTGNLNGQNGWSKTWGGEMVVADNSTLEGDRLLLSNVASLHDKSVPVIDTSELTGIYYYRFLMYFNSLVNYAYGTINLTSETRIGISHRTDIPEGFFSLNTGYEFYCDSKEYIQSGSMDLIPPYWTYQDNLGIEKVIEVVLEFNFDDNLFKILYKTPGTEGYFNFSDANNRCYWVNSEKSDFNLFNLFRIRNDDNADFYIDELGFYEFGPPSLRVWSESPESGSIITDIDDNFTIKWEGWDLEWVYKDFVFRFVDQNTGMVSHQIIYTPETESGEIVFKFSDFGFEKNSKYDFSAIARSYYFPEWGVFYTSELVNPAYWVEIDVEGWTPVFEMPPFTDWYAEKVERFATPTAVFTGITGVLSPIFSKIGEFGESAVKFLDIGQAYQTGYDLGKIIPLFKHYVEAIEFFLGGFPIIQIFLVFMILLIGIFIVRLILKFIPFFGK